MKNRLQRVNELLKRELSQCIERDMEFPGTIVTVHAVDVTPDLRRAHVYVGVIGDARQCSDAVKKLNKNRNHLQNEVGRRVVLKNTPYFEFRGDDSVARGVRVVALLDEIALTLPADPEIQLVSEPYRDEWDEEDKLMDLEEEFSEEEEEGEEEDDWDDDDDIDEEDWEEVDEEADDDLGLVFGADEEEDPWDDGGLLWKKDEEDEDDDY
ncbi:MAG: 30S ribosome-binding factor RbfA [Verrucomicrobiales bacterium]|nr:30S ribosome-binding factor RbfA [Verrucomicrobiae bacterium]MCP5555420.1 30S ribosome-binding factor RbfA [Akkermansiaceae bacterium]HRX53773.1 30S ribosome-binding factor RbfA [Verrucomicrobiales bacterium]